MEDKKREKLIIQILKFFGKKKVYLSVNSAKRELKKQEMKNKMKYSPPLRYKHFAERETFVGEEFGKMDFFVKNGNDRIILYLHGGAFCTQPIVFHWLFLDKMFEKTGATIYMPLYPLSPKNSYKETYSALLEFYKFLLTKKKKIFIMGDSAGATLTLGLTHLIKEQKLPLPDAIFPMSPVVDMHFDNDEVQVFEKFDPMLSRDGCKFICQTWAKGADFSDPLVSPLYIDFNGFPDIYLFYGTYEIFCPDIRKFVEKVQSQKVKLLVFEEKRMYHTYPLFPIPKAERAQDIMAGVII